MRNWQDNGKWQKEESGGKFTLHKEHNFEINIVCNEKDFKVLINDEDFCTFKHRKPPTTIDKIQIDGDIDLYAVHLK